LGGTTLDFFSLDFWSKLFGIVFIDLLLAGDNAIVIALAARNLPKETQKKAIFWGMAGAIAIRAAAAIIVMQLLKVPYLLAAGGVVLLWIAFKLLVEEKKHEEVKAGSSLWAAVRTIVIADAAMGLDNILAIGGMAHGNALLVILGLLISIPIIIWGSTLFIRLIHRFPWIVYLGSGILAYTAAKMITEEQKLEFLFKDNPTVTWTLIVTLIAVVIVGGLWVNTIRARKNAKADPAYAGEKSRE
jgi:YjbE family integral membrane protein